MAITKQCMLTTIDNPYDPFDNFAQWFLYDVEKGYNSCSLLDRIAKFTDEMTVEERKIETERAIDEIIEYDSLQIYKKVRWNIEIVEKDDEE